MSLRGLPPLPMAERPAPRDKASQTLLSRQAVCPRSAALYLRHDGGVASHAMHRGSALHEFCRDATLYLIDQGEHQLPWEVGKDIMSEIVGQHPEWAIPPDEMDVLRLAAYHWCECTVIDPATVVAVEKLFELPIGEYRVRGKVDIAFAVDGGVRVDDYKSQAFVPSQEEIDGKVQLPLYALLVGEGYPVDEAPCDACGGTGEIVWATPDPDRPPLRVEPGRAYEVRDPERTILSADECEDCDGKGRIETPQAPIGQRFGSFDLHEVYPRLEPWLEGTAKVLPYRQRTISRHELVDQRLYVEGLVAKLDHGLKTGEWPAVPGSHCSTCAAPAECPLPAHLRDHRGSITTLEQAVEAGEKLAFEKVDHAARLKELREFAKTHDVAVPFGSDEEWGFETVESEEWITGKKIGRPDTASARQAMQDAIDRAVRLGEPFVYEDFRRPRRSSKFDRRKVKAETSESVSPAEGTPEAALRASVSGSVSPEERQARLDEQFGKDAPF